MSLLNSSRKHPILCYVTDRRSLSDAPASEVRELLLKKIAAAAAAGVDWIQIREKDFFGKDCAAVTREALRRAANTGAAGGAAARILVNDRLDVALTEDAGGVHLGEESLPVSEARRLLNTTARPRNFLIGVSCHALESAHRAERDGADYIFFGPVFATPSKAANAQPQGIARLAEVCRSVSIPVLAIGGINLENVATCLAAGAAGIAAIRLFQGAADLPQISRALRAPMKKN